jgi:hypothetical protein
MQTKMGRDDRNNYHFKGIGPILFLKMVLKNLQRKPHKNHPRSNTYDKGMYSSSTLHSKYSGRYTCSSRISH